ncbi:MAG TPA: family 1 glycosylhydrolase [Chthonomonadaceae bacterium]|nr:family 1 glycosylhydrolase [Chthonomonadaceae bacterium]
MFATGIENSYPTIQLPNGKTFRVDEMEKTGHYRYWREDFDLVTELGIRTLRYGPPYYSTHKGPGRYDWSFADETFSALHDLRIQPIADLCHFGVPDWIGNFQNPEWPAFFAEYAGTFAARYPWIRYFTPVNEIFITAMFSAQYGWWNERLTSDTAFVNALKHLCQANVLAMRAILEVRQDAVFIQSESSEYFHAEHPDGLPRANFLNEKRFLSLDLTYGYPLRALMYEYLLDNGMTREEYHWFHAHQVKARCVMGNDYYVTNEHLVHNDGTTEASGEIFGYYVITHQYFDRYHLPVMHTETNIAEPKSVDWLKKEWANLYRLKQDGVPIIGFTWFSLIDQVDWDTALRENNGHVNPLGLYSLERKINPVGRVYKELIEEWRKVLPPEDSTAGFIGMIGALPSWKS